MGARAQDVDETKERRAEEPSKLDLPLLLGWTKAIAFVFGGCCTNAWAMEQLLKASSSIGTTLTLFQMSFVACQGLLNHLDRKDSFPFLGLRPRTVPFRRWALQVIILWSMSLLNNLALSYHVPVSLMIVFRSGGLGVSMFFGYFFLGRHYNRGQVTAIVVATLGVILTTVSRPVKRGHASQESSPYALGILLLILSSFLTGYLGMLQERTYLQYGRCWQEGLFYTNALALPLFLPFSNSIYTGIQALRNHSASTSSHLLTLTLPIYLLSQLGCVSGVGMLTSRVSSVSTNLILTARKALSLIISVALLGSSWSPGMSVGSGMVFLGGIWYGIATQSNLNVAAKAKDH